MKPALSGFRKCSPKTETLLLERMFQAVLTLLLLTLPVLSIQAAEPPWPTTRFKVFAGNPFVGTGSEQLDNLLGNGWQEFEDLYGKPSDEVIQEIERAFTEAAVWYKEKGFPPPLLEPLTGDGSAYQVYICKAETAQSAWEGFWNFLGMGSNNLVQIPWGQCGYNASTGKTVAGAYLPLCNNDATRTKIMYVNSDKAIDPDGKLNEVGYQTIAHELMHAIIANTQFGRADSSCEAQHWIAEGIPDAISYDIADELWKNRYFPDNSDGALIKKYGYRPYSVILTESRDAAGAPGESIKFDFKYTASSFWRYLADSNNGWKNLLVSPKQNGLLDRTLTGSSSSNIKWEREAAWISKGLQDKFARNLSDVYGSFVNNYAYRFPPMKNYRGRPVEEVLPKWVKNVFGNCAIADLSSAQYQTITLSVRALASGCIWVESIGVPGMVHVSFQTINDDRSLLEDITIGMAGTMLVSRAAPIAPSPINPTAYLASWRDYPQDGSKRTLYIVSNVARQPELSKERHLVFDVSRPEFTNSALATVPWPPAPVAARPQKPSFDKHAPSMATQRRATAKMVEEQMNLDKKSLNPNVNSATDVTRNVNQPDCTEPFVYSACGPQLSISLGLVPGTFIVPGVTNTQGGIAAQGMGGLQAMAATSLYIQDDVKALSDVLDSIDGSNVSIAIPLIEYGYTGSITNAAISVRMSGGKSLSAFGPPDESGRTRLRGRVTIEEYSPFVMRGSFSAPLAEFVLSGEESVYTSRETVSGSFNLVAPWQSDERVQFIMESPEQMADDIANSLGIPADMIYSMKQEGTMPGAPGYQGPGSSGQGGGVQTTGCSCECAHRPFADELCELFCEEEYAACESP